MNALNAYYKVKPYIPRSLQIALRRKLVLLKRYFHKDVWPIDERAGEPPFGWPGWPDGKKFALVLTHDVDTSVGHEKCLELMKLEERLGFRSSFNFVPERYSVSSGLRRTLVENGFEVGVHGLNHDGKLFESKEIFDRRRERINRYLKQWGAKGFRAPSMHHDLNWILELDIDYDLSTFDTDPFEPQSEGAGTIFPFWFPGGGSRKGYVELPYTLPQDFTLFILMKQKNTGIWRRKLDWIASKGGMVLMNTHPDYMDFEGKRSGIEEYPVAYYEEFLLHVKNECKDRFWHVLPNQIAQWAIKTLIGEFQARNETCCAEAF